MVAFHKLRCGAGIIILSVGYPALAGKVEAPAQPPADANVFILRDYAEPVLMGATVMIDDRKVTSLGQHSYTAAVVKPGVHLITTKWPKLSFQRSGEIPVIIEPGKSYYFVITGQSDYVGGLGLAMRFKMGSGIVELMPDSGVAAIAKCCKFKQSIYEAGNDTAAAEAVGKPPVISTP